MFRGSSRCSKVYRNLSEKSRWTAKTKEEPAVWIIYAREKNSLCRVPHIKKPSWRVHLAWLSYRFILIWGNVRVRRGERMCVTQETEESDRFNRLLETCFFLGASQSRVREEKSWGWFFCCFFFFLPLPLLSQSAMMPRESGRFQLQSWCTEPSNISNNVSDWQLHTWPPDISMQ